jgi:peptidoglycan/xylan/chitin deacetylase (PgdA/CDA1 family)
MRSVERVPSRAFPIVWVRRLPNRSLILAGLVALVSLVLSGSAAPVAQSAPIQPGSASISDPAGDVAGGLDLTGVTIKQNVGRINVAFHFAGVTDLAALGTSHHRMVCLVATGHHEFELCLTGQRSGARTLYRLPLAAGAPRAGFVAATVTRETHELSVAFDGQSAGFAHATYYTYATTHIAATVAAVCAANACDDRAPDSGGARFRFHAYRANGCAAAAPYLRYSQPVHSREIALTFDDGPSPYTPAILGLLQHYHVHATFFEIGDEMRGRGATMRRILADGDALGDHSWDHHIIGPSVASWEIGRTRTLQTAMTGYRTCLFRPPYGTTFPGTIAIAKRMGIVTVNWDVDPRDWSLPGTSKIISNVLANAHPGAIVLSHDGGGDRSETVAAYRVIIPTLLARGYKLVTLPQMFGLRSTYRYLP